MLHGQFAFRALLLIRRGPHQPGNSVVHVVEMEQTRHDTTLLRQRSLGMWEYIPLNEKLGHGKSTRFEITVRAGLRRSLTVALRGPGLPNRGAP